MTTETTVEKNITSTEAHWAAEAGARLATHREARRRRAAEEVAQDRRRLPPDEMQRRFAAVVACVLDAMGEFATAAEIQIEASPPAATQLELRAGQELLRLTIEDDAMRIKVASPSRGEETLVDLAGDDFKPEPTARTIAEAWIQRLAAAEGVPHAR